MPTWGCRRSDMEPPGHSDARFRERVKSDNDEEFNLTVGANRPLYSDNRARSVSLPPPSVSPPFPTKWIRDSFSEERTLPSPWDQERSRAKPTTTWKTTTTTSLPVGTIPRNKKRRVRVKRVIKNQCEALKLYDEGRRDSQIAQKLRIPVNVIRGWIRKYRLNGKKTVTKPQIPIPIWNGPSHPSYVASSSSSSLPPGTWFQAVPTYRLPDSTRPRNPATAGGQQIYIAPLELAFRQPEYAFGDIWYAGQAVMFPGNSATMIDQWNLNYHHVDAPLRLAALFWPAPAPYGSNDPLASRAHLPPTQTDLRNFSYDSFPMSNSGSSGEESTDQEATPRKKCKDLNDNVVFPEEQRINTHADRVDNYAPSTQPIQKRSQQMRFGDFTHLEYLQACEKERCFKNRYPESNRRTGKSVQYSKAQRGQRDHTDQQQQQQGGARDGDLAPF
ncbi:uncharacterized protein LOC106651851 [Trichogramma pretiosum]|uniref:uncharacterized protein LOC106651851 n=1 Tax=Trichogramma pretiosum TaxID=7493 RepID=UPI0006C94C02|nr:uncharacterized protein LOC106651851 [Trichogramma pretiosum]